MKKIAFVRLRYLPPSETFIYEELKNIKSFEPIVFTRKKMNLNRFPFSRIKRLPHKPTHIARKFKEKKIRLIHARFGNAGVNLMGVKRRLRIPMVTSFHGFDLPAKRSRHNTYQRKLPMLFRIGDIFTVPSRQMEKQLIRWGCPGHKIRVMYSGIDLKKFAYVPRESKTGHITIIAVGRLHKKKGFRYLLHAFKKVHAKHPSVRLIIVGDGDERGNLKRRISALKLNKCVRLTGLVAHHQLSGLLNRADIFCLPSVTTNDGNHEGIPNAIKEAMAIGLPIVSTRHGGIPELVTDGQEGLLVPEKNVDMLAKKLKYLIEHPSLWKEMGSKGREKVENQFNSAKQVRSLEAIYKELIRKGK
ncbi:glycosyltransferase [Paenibacillus eucommiae]|uniref:Glycosyltransferase involved in cell wall biosynthesis n=1 Tax=Paenibacillus eucommiae TaxID=1355755 RepID=A0ABS4ITS2_9BACL|nr:glycosyltransferase [Paenibacillus eucommiae]MBP1990981.1 glycosyltransferase involved in cell wall biosynthesis [Paenibacillus eucommiae]